MQTKHLLLLLFLLPVTGIAFSQSSELFINGDCYERQHNRNEQ